MIYETDRDNFASIMHVTWQSCGRNKPDRETMRYWFDKLIAFDFKVVADAFDRWLISKDELPTVHQIINLCKPITPIYNAIARKADKEANKAHAKEVVDYIAKNLKPKTDFKAWAKRILANPGNFPENSVKAARDAMNVG